MEERTTDSATAVDPSKPVVGTLPMLENVRHRSLEVYHLASKEVVTRIEILSPTIKTDLRARRQYIEKRLEVLSSLTNLVEIDLLRSGEPMPMSIQQKSDYRIVVSHYSRRPSADIYLFSVRDRIPNFPIPLMREDEEPMLPLNALLHAVYDLAAYDMVIDYGKSAEPPLSKNDAEWVREVILPTPT